MRGAYVCADPGVPIFGHKGCSIHVRELVRALRAEGVELTLFAASAEGSAPSDLADLPVRAITGVRGEPGASAVGDANAAIATALAGAGPLDFVYERYSLWSFAAMEYARDRGIPGLLEVNAPLVEEAARHRGLRDRAGALRVAEKVFGAASYLLPVSGPLADHLRRGFDRCAPIVVTPNAVDPARFPEPAARAGRAGPLTLGFVGSLRAWHGIDELADGFSRVSALVPEARLLVVGDGPERDRLERALVDAGVDGRSDFTGAVSSERVPELLASVDVALAPYPPLEPFYFSPLKVFEYMAAGCAIVASAIGQVAEVIEDGRTGLLHAPGDGDAMARHCLALQADPALRARLGSAARATVAQRYSWSAVAEQVMDLAVARGRTVPAAAEAC